MRNERINNAFGQTPEAFTRRIDQTLRNLEEEKPMKRLTLRTALVTVLVLALLGSIAYAVVSQGMEWYYNNRFTAYQQYEPEKHEAILSHLQTVQVQEGQDDPLVNVEVREASWVPEHQTLVISLAAVPKNADKAELHPEWNLDPDGNYVGAENLADYADDPEARGEHWLLTKKGFGPVNEVMNDPSKQLALFDASHVYLGAMEDELDIMSDMSSLDCYVNEAGEVMTVIEARLDWLSPDYDQQQLEWSKGMPQLSGMIQERIRKARIMRESVALQNDVMQISIPYTVTTYSDDDQQMQDSRYMKYVTFEINIE